MATKTTKSVKKSTATKTKSATPADVKPVVKTETKKHASLSIPVFSVDGKESGAVALPESLFGVKVNKALLAQAIRVFLANQREGGARTKTRGMVEGSTRKIYRQKGTGRARHGSVRAPIFVGGGIVFGPVEREYRLTMTKQMKRSALASALSSKKDDMYVVDGFENVGAKTKQVALSLKAIGAGKDVLLVVPSGATEFMRAARNISGVTMINAKDIYPYAVVTHRKIVFTKGSLGESITHFTKEV